MAALKNNEKVVYPELSYKIIGILFDVYNELGPGYREKHYEEAVARVIDECDIKYKRQLKVPVMFKGKDIGKDFLDFLIEDKIVLELKKGDNLSRKHIEQIYEYLKLMGLKLGIIAHFSSKELKYKRILNIK